MPESQDICVFRAMGDDFDANQFLAEWSLPRPSVFKKGETRPSRCSPSRTSGLVCEVSSGDLESQIAGAVRFLEDYRMAIVELRNCEDVESIGVDFMYSQPGECAASVEQFWFPSNLTGLLGELGLSLCITRYA
ncbi:hypothetical protein Pla111_08240 [Botrimarina hoheduenensis]|uniref:DUF4279 domain-containing protein n=1 Tax=Botrimarina hoheduenensis TaxID=2528000 RepID=A0A5C5WC33_9BACT|nr:hypothetical protein Pla111_08240 [Botrimarina hoheduenensis]